ncbi:protein translocase subunit secG [Andreprevotia lacus DSM 23236]|jgi:preprotein translocase subunit SecG|uniref:Protein-export membrane protein SecG n=1 Tax=Andreprevotia lacus DSM 23236 TaxID=1121001 RepID=A0A1W1WZT1_9NEIS|nr:preprotein translocase subunit SecG [Andreprevotia lacus]SMC17127.1 protein translocase subunit secG [Andreprevotia lacus DSM 23236]
MEFLQSIVLILNVISAGAVIVLVLLQHGKGADMGAAFGSGSAGSLFGSAGSANFLSRSTAVAAFVFFTSCLGLTYIMSHSSSLMAGSKAAPVASAVAASAASAVPAQAASGTKQIPE